MKYLFINSTAGWGSTGRIAAEKCRELMAEGHECVLAYGRMDDVCTDVPTYQIGTALDYRWHGLMTRLFDLNGFCSKRATRRFLAWVRDYNPDVIWLHNVHGYYINVEMLFDYLKNCGKPIKWTLHDCWSFTGHCAHFVAVDCMQWQTECRQCQILRAYPACYGISNVSQNYMRKRAAFTNVPNMSLVVPSKWLGNLVEQSYLSEYPVEVVYNTIDTNTFRPTPSDFRERYGLQDRIIVLGVASFWTRIKGQDDLYQLAQMLDDRYAIVMVGLSGRQIEEVPRYISGVTKMDGSDNGVAIYVPTHSCGNSDIPAVPIQGDAVIDRSPEALYRAITGEEFLGTVRTLTCNRLICIPRTDSARQLAEIYTASDVFVNATYEDNYPTVNLEAIACGTHVITYNTGGCAETLDYKENL